MPYASNADLPPPTRRALPPHAQAIYRSARAAVKKRYLKRGDVRVERVGARSYCRNI